MSGARGLGRASVVILAACLTIAACGDDAARVEDEAPPASVRACPEPAAAGQWRRTAAVPPELLTRDPVFPDIVYGFTPAGILRSSDGLRSFCPVYSWETPYDGGYVYATILAGSVRRSLRVVRRTAYWGSLVVSTDDGSTWSQHPVRVAGSEPLPVVDLTIDPATDRLYAIAQDLGLVSSTDYGETWELLQPNPVSGWFTGLSADPAPSGNMYVTAMRSGAPNELWRSRDSGMTWAPTVIPISPDWNGVQVDYADRVTLYAYRDDAWTAPLRSLDGGKTFEPLPFVGRLQLHPTHPGTIYLDDVTHPLLVSFDGGDSFKEFPSWNDSRRTPDGDPPISPIMMNAPSLLDARDPGKVIFRTDLGFFENALGGTVRALGTGVVPAFTPPVLSNRSGPTYELWVDPRSADHLLAVANGALMESRDGGETFSLHEGAQRFEVIPGSVPVGSEESQSVFAVDAGDPDVYYLWGLTTLWVSGDAGRVWTPQPLGDKEIMFTDPLSPSTLYARPRSEEPAPPPDCARWRSRDRGHTWQCLATPAADAQVIRIHDLVTYPGDARIIYGLDGGIGVFRSTDGGASWSRPDSPPFPPGRGGYIRMLISPSDPDRLYVVALGPTTFDGDVFEGLFESDDRGASWELKTTDTVFRPAVIDPRSSDVLYSDGANAPVSVDGGLTWTVGGPPPGENAVSLLAVGSSTPRVVYARGALGLYRR